MFLPLDDDNSDRRTTPYVTWSIIALNLCVWLLQLGLGPEFTYKFSAIPYELTNLVDLSRPFETNYRGDAYPLSQSPGLFPIYFTVISAMFLHASWIHIIGNMLYFRIFGDQIEDILGHKKFLLFYLACGVAATVAFVAFQPSSKVPTLGASGAIAGVLGAYLVKFPKKEVETFFIRTVVEMPAYIVLASWIGLQVVAQISAPPDADIAYMAHIGGFLAGVILVFALRPQQKTTQPIT